MLELIKRRKKLFASLVCLLLLVGGAFIYLYFFRQPPPLEKRFVVEKLPVPVASPEATPSITLAQPGEKALLSGTKVAYQTFNNCGPATLSMILSYYDIRKSQKELGDEMRPYQHPQGDNDDKIIFPTEFVAWVEKFGLKAAYRPNGSLELLKLFLANEIPVVVKTWLRPNEDIGHFRIIRGFDEGAKVLIDDDSYFGPNRRLSYFDFMSMWQPFNYGYIPVYKPEKEEIVKAILGQEQDSEVAYWKAVNRAQKENQLDPNNIYPFFNLSTSYYHVGEYEKSVTEFKKVESRLPRRMLWYQIEPILAYKELKNYGRVFEISNWLFDHGNRAFSELYQIRGEIYLERGDKEAARREFESALQYNQNFQPAKEALLNL
ncbi:C39 family peptidase [Patescibacteria group bacterium]|nr:C39 family peptidase [Patescibacteria group bacterium]